jgi:nitroimidazol reductase NimA-like FMN-containing flavoprotein (pyridoxamine 5'-phosphate oxidase superfamily)
MSSNDTPTTGLTAPSARSSVRRAADRAHYDHATIHPIVDAAHVCHVGFADSDEPMASVLCIPTACWRVGDQLYIHGSNGSRMMKRLGQGAQACVTITHLDGLVMAKSAFSHSMNYRSVVIHGRFTQVPDDDKMRVLDALMDHLAPGRKGEVRAPDSTELNATTVVGIALSEAAAKIRNWGPRDKPEDIDRPVWSGVLPLLQAQSAPVAEPPWPGPLPDYVGRWGS